MAETDMPVAELAAITGEDSGVVWVDTQHELADELGVDRRTIVKWRREDIMNPPPRKTRGKYNVIAWREWMIDADKKGLKKTEAIPMKYELEVRKLTAVCEQLELQHQITLGQYHLNSDCQLWMGRAITAVRTILLAIPSKMAPVMEMRPKEECESLLRGAIDEALIVIHEKEWPSSKTP